VFALWYHSSGIIVYSLKMASCEPKHVDVCVCVCVLAIKSCVRQLFISNFFLHIKLNGMNHTTLIRKFDYCKTLQGGSGSSVGVATDYGLDGPGSNPGGDEIFRQARPALGPTQPPVQWVPGLSRG